MTTEENQQIKQLQIEMKKLQNENSFLRSKVNFNKLKKPKTTQLKKLNESEENQPIKKGIFEHHQVTGCFVVLIFT